MFSVTGFWRSLVGAAVFAGVCSVGAFCRAEMQAGPATPSSPAGVSGQAPGAGTGMSLPGNAPSSTGFSSPQSPTPAKPEGTQEMVDGRPTRGSMNQDGRASEIAPDQPTEFQRMVQLTTGQPLPVFGASLFSGVPSTFAPVDDIPVTPDYVIGPGDQLRLQVWGQVNQQGSYVVDRTGSIALPQVGTVHVAGLRFSELTGFLRSQLGRVYRNFDLNVNMGQLRSIQVFVVGQARRPGSYTIGSLSTLVNALFASGGPTSQGSVRDIQVRRGSDVVIHFDLYDLLLRGDKSKDVVLQPGDVIFLPPVGPQVALVGSVRNPAIYELRGETRITQLLEMGGGRTNVAAGTSVRVERIFEHALRTVQDVDLQSAPETPLQDGDVVSVTSIVDRFRDAVTLRGNVANPGRYVWHPGMRVGDLFPNKEALITRNYWRKRSELGQPALEYTPASPGEGALRLQNGSTQNRSGADGANTGATVGQNGSTQQGTTRSTLSGGGGSSVGVALTGTNGVFDARTDVILSAPDIDWSYAVIERQSAVDLKTSLLSFDLGKVVLDRDPTQNLELLSGDVVTIFSTADIRVPTSQQTRFVRLEGEFNAAGVYSVRPGETFRQLLLRSGGFTPDAYLYASEFTRESTRRVERQRLSEYADELEAQVSSAVTGAASNAVSGQDAAAATASADEARAAIARLRTRDPVGRIVLDLRPDSRGVESVPDLVLEDGDRFVVPRVPSNIYVTGQVYSANAFVFQRGRRVIDYLRQAGGPDRQADRKRAFVIRADGSVLSRQYGRFERAQLFPGDTIVVPPRLDRRSVLRTVVDLASIVGQVGFAAAAISVVR